MIQSNAKARPLDQMTRFERAVVFRVARGYFFAMAIVAVLLFLAGAVVGARSMIKHDVPRPTAPAAPGERRPLTYHEVAEVLQRKEEQARTGAAVQVEPQSGDSGSAASGPVDPELDAASKELHAAFPDPPYSWDNEIEKACVVPTSFGCLQWGTRVKRQGVISALNLALRGTPRDELVSYIRVLARVLKEAPVEKRLEIVPAVLATERTDREKQEQLVASHTHKVKELEEKYQADLDANNAKYRQLREFALYGVGAGFSLLIVVSLFLAFLSMERHTRALEQLTERLASQAMPVASEGSGRQSG